MKARPILSEPAAEAEPLRNPSAPSILRPVGEAAILVDFGDAISETLNARVTALDALLASEPLPGVIETVPAYASLLVVFDPLVTSHALLAPQILARAERCEGSAQAGKDHLIPVRYDESSAPDLKDVAERLSLSVEAVVALHLEGLYRVYMYGFAPGYAYMGGVVPQLQMPRKPRPVRGLPAGSVLIAGAQCLIMPISMPTGWWVIGHTDVPVLRPDGDSPFLFSPGDRVRFVRQ